MKYNNTKIRDSFYLEKIAMATSGYENGEIIDLRTREGRERFLSRGEKIKNDGNGGLLYAHDMGNGAFEIINEELCNTLVYGSTGTGKTTRYQIMYTIFVAKQGKANIVVTSTKDDNYNILAPILKGYGYEVKLISNKTGTESSEGYNPLDPIVKKYKENFEAIGRGIVVADDGFEYKGRHFSTEKSLEEYLLFEQKSVRENVFNKVYELYIRLAPVESSKDPHWEKQGITGKSILTSALIFSIFSLDMFRIKPEQVTIENMGIIYDNWFRRKPRGGIEDRGYITRFKEIGSEFSDHYISNASTTIQNYISFLTGAIKHESESFRKLTRYSTIDVEKDFGGDKKVAYFLIADETKERSGEEFSFLVTNAILEPLRDIADKSEGSALKRPVIFLLDEFANMPKNMQFVKLCSTCRSRNIHLHYLIQNEEQLDALYGQMDSATIKSNCSTQIFLGSNNEKCIRSFQERFGKRAYPTSNSLNITENGDAVYEFVERPVVTYSELESVGDGVIYIKRDRGANLISHLPAYYQIKEFVGERANLYQYESQLSRMDTFYAIPTEESDDDDDDDDLF